jgi:methionyl-tRNA formyltransferase
MVDGQEIKVWKTAVVRDAPKNIEPGKVLMQADSTPIVKCGSGAIRLLVTEPSFELTAGSYI